MSRTRRPAIRSARSPTPPPTTPRPPSTQRSQRAASGPRRPSNERSEILYEAFRKIGERVDALALLMTLEMGKAVAESKGEVAYAAEFFRWNAGEALRIDGYYKQAGNGASRVLVMRQPVGPCYLITPWNFPAAMGTRKIGPAIAAGCTMVIKPAQFTPLSMLALGEILQECGLPGGRAQHPHDNRIAARCRSRSSATRGCAS